MLHRKSNFIASNLLLAFSSIQWQPDELQNISYSFINQCSGENKLFVVVAPRSLSTHKCIVSVSNVYQCQSNDRLNL